jgi:hypothetical protein
MALAGSIAISMKLATTKFGKDLASAGAAIKNFEKQLGGVQTALATAFVGGGALAGIYKTISAASELSESTSAMKATFGDSAGAIEHFNNNMTAGFGIANKELLQAEAMFGGLFKNLGYSTDDAAQLSIQMVKLAGDLASFKNLSFDEALNKIRAGITGESEPLKAIGILINEAAVKQEAFNMGLAKGNQELTESQKVQARLSILAKQTADSQGDLAKTFSGVANSSRAFFGEITNLAAAIGESLQPAAMGFFSDMNVALGAATQAWADMGSGATAAVGESLQSVWNEISDVGVLQTAVRSVADAWSVVSIAFTAVQTTITQGLSYIMSGIGYLIDGFDKIYEAAGLARTGLGEFFHDFSKGLEDEAIKGLNKLDEKLKAPWPSQQVDQYFANAKKKAEDARKATEAVKIAPNAFKPQAGANDIIKSRAEKGMSAMAFGSSEATNTILRSRGAGGGGKTAADTAKNTSELVSLTKQLVERSKKGCQINLVDAF